MGNTSRYRFIWWGFGYKKWMLPRFHSLIGFYRFTGWEAEIWEWVVWFGPLNFSKRPDSFFSTHGAA